MTTTTASFTPNPLQNQLHYNGSTNFPSYNGYPLQIEKTLGHGSFGDVLLVRNTKTNELYAVKRVHKCKNQENNLMREVRAGGILQHDNIVKFIGHYEDSSYNYLVFEHIHGCDLFALLEELNFKPLSEQDARKIVKQIMNAVIYCHSKNVVHFDIKLDNIMINKSTHKATLIDFGLSDFIDPEKGDAFNRRCGSEEYCPPELLVPIRGNAPDVPFSGKKTDVWCLGIVLYALLTAMFPFDRTTRKQVALGMRKHPTAPFKTEIPPLAQDLLSKMLCPDAAQRISMEEIANHPWMTAN